jgi:hypothetical protein
MASVTLNRGDQFVAHRTPQSSVYGIVISDRKAVLISGSGGRTGWQFVRGPIPEKAIPLEFADATTPYEVKFALDIARSALNIPETASSD